ncbi:MAG: hypothetical protein ABFC31_10800 [Clostridiaceae bacterium]
MKILQNPVQGATHQQPLIKRMFRGCFRFLGTFLFILFMTHNLLVSMRVDVQWHEPIASIVAFSCFVCVTIGANYWYGDCVVRWRSYCIAGIITFFLYFAFLVFLISDTNYKVNLLQFAVITSLPIVSTVYSIRKLRQAKKMKQEGAISRTKHPSTNRSVALANAVRIVALVSFCSVFHQYVQLVLTFILEPKFRTIRMYPFSVALDAIVAAYAIWLLICFARKEFVQLSKQKESEKDCVENKSGGY